MLSTLILLPTLAGLAAFFIKSNALRRLLIVLTAAAHSGLVCLAWVRPAAPTLGGWLMLDSLGLLFLSITSALFLAAAAYAVGYLSRENWGRREDFEEGFLFTNTREASFTGCFLLFLAMMTLVTMSQHFGLLWVGVEATTLASAPLIYFHRHRRSLEATWKYIMICSVGIALALLGNFFLAVASLQGEGRHVPMLVASLVDGAENLSVPWLRAAFLFLLVGYGTKLGLAPMHTWLPDAHSEAPSVVSALLSGALLNCAFLAILRIYQVCLTAGLGDFSRSLLLGFGLLSMGVAAIFIIRQQDFKRMLAYSSVEHMGILSLGVGLGGSAVFGVVLHALNHSMVKGMLFFVAGNILTAYRTKSTEEIAGVQKLLPISGVLWVAGFLAITGSPPFGPFVSELVILRAAIEQGNYGIAVIYLALLSIIFIGMATIVLRMYQGRPKPIVHSPDGVLELAGPVPEHSLAVIPPAALGLVALLLGLYIPPALQGLLEQAARSISG